MRCGVLWCFPSSLGGMFEAWYFPPFYGDGKVLWRIIPGAILWSTWKERNDRVFRRSLSPMEDILVLVEMQIIKWISSRSDFDNIRVNGVLQNWQISLMCGISKIKKVVLWGPLSGGVLRFNVDGWLEES